ncbi:hypothetical protein GGI42DRAFT_125673 [Trichoderma sp. SZMC 28013]
MNERTRSAGSSRTTRSAGLAAASSSSANGSKTSLFRSHFIRRPNAAAADAEGVRQDGETTQQQSEAAELVVRDQHGEVEIGNPPTPVVDDEEELQALEYQQENEREKQRLAEAIRHYQISHSSMADQPDALFEAVRESNRSKVSALAEDNWMFEPEEQPRIS